jgi:predicted transcriptional regulator
MNASNFFAELKRRNLSKVALMSWLEEQNKGRQVGWEKVGSELTCRPSL